MLLLGIEWINVSLYSESDNQNTQVNNSDSDEDDIQVCV